MIHKNLANIVTALRIILTPVLLYFVVTGAKNEFFWLAMIIMFTDVIDGSLARPLKKESRFGQTLDSVADFVLYPVYAIGSILLLRLFTYMPIWVLFLPIVLPTLSIGVFSRLLTGRFPLLHLRLWQVTSHAYTFFIIVSFTWGVNIGL